MEKIVLIILALALVACGKREESSGSKENTAESRVSRQNFDFQVIQSPITGKCYETVNVSNSYSFSRIFEISCDSKK